MLNERDVRRIRETYLFGECPAETVARLDEDYGCRIRPFEKDQRILCPACFRRELCILLEGSVRVTKSAANTLISDLNAGDVFGAASLFNDEKDYVSTLTATEQGKALAIPQEGVLRLIDEIPSFRRRYVRYLSSRIRFLSDRVDTFADGSPAARLEQFLIRRSDPDGVVRLPFSMKELADRLNIGRASLYRELDRLVSEGTVRREGKKIVIEKPGMLLASRSQNS